MDTTPTPTSTSIPYIPIGIGLFTIGGYMCRKHIWNGLLTFGNWSINKFVDLKWRFMNEPDIAASISAGAPARCKVVDDKLLPGHYVYHYHGNTYAAPSLDSIPYIDHLDQVYDPEERIESVKFYRDGMLIDADAEAVGLVDSILRCLIGPLCDFHGTIPELSYFQEHIPNVDKIVVHTEHFKEFVIV